MDTVASLTLRSRNFRFFHRNDDVGQSHFALAAKGINIITCFMSYHINYSGPPVKLGA